MAHSDERKLPLHYGFSILLVLLKEAVTLDIYQTNLRWETFNGYVPYGAVFVHNGRRTDYVCKYGEEASFYSPGLDSYCHYAYANRERRESPFEILVNQGNIEFLEWKSGSYGSVPADSVYTSSSREIYVAKNNRGLGKVHCRHEAFFVAHDGSEIWYKHYDVLTVNRDIISEDIYNVRYHTAGVQVIQYPPETMDTSVINNYSCEPVTGTATLAKTDQVTHTWESSHSFSMGVRTSMTAGIPLIASATIEFSMETTFQFTTGTSYSKATTYSVSVQHPVPPNHSCTVTMVGRRHRADLPYTADVRRTYRYGATTWTSISGTYRSVQMGEVRSMVHRSERLPYATPC